MSSWSNHPLQRLPGQKHLDSEPLRDSDEVAPVERHDRIGPPVRRRFEDELVARIAQLGAPQEPGLDGLDQIDNGIEELPYLRAPVYAKPRRLSDAPPDD